MAEEGKAARAAAPARPTIALPPRSSVENIFLGGGAMAGVSPGPMTLVSSFFSDTDPDSDYRSFSQLLAGAMASPGALTSPLSLAGRRGGEESAVKEVGESDFRIKQNRPPLSLVIAQSPSMFTVPPGLSPASLLDSPGFFSPVGQGPFGMSHQQALAQVTAQAVQSQSHMLLPSDYSSLLARPATALEQHLSFATPQNLPPLSVPKSSTADSSVVSHSDPRSQVLPPVVDKPADDGYNWRKYGQKQVKGSEYPRSYYKCTHPHCPVKKKVERSLDGHVTEIIYKGQHNHQPPHSTRRQKETGSSNGNVNSQGNAETGNISRSSETMAASSKSRRDQDSSQMTPEQLSGSSDGEEVNDAEARVDDVDDEPDPKRRNTEVRVSEAVSSHKAVTEPRIIVQTTSEVDLLDDGYRWRKYGQKVVKGNPHPRSYYKCTSAGCNVRKHVERASTDAKAVITTYEGKHNHDVPAARNSSHHNAANNSVPSLKSKFDNAEKHAMSNEVEFTGNTHQSASLSRLKEERVS
ncbi:hypothetical protein Syun_023437 [Stephania yunnanensis]|uniref:WRKY domain-containing protein n=1 Tax=Stephania yunnanensis TaxID=152371 RepID=A0AAP0F9U0_9MAGN